MWILFWFRNPFWYQNEVPSQDPLWQVGQEPIQDLSFVRFFFLFIIEKYYFNFSIKVFHSKVKNMSKKCVEFIRIKFVQLKFVILQQVRQGHCPRIQARSEQPVPQHLLDQDSRCWHQGGDQLVWEIILKRLSNYYFFSKINQNA